MLHGGGSTWGRSERLSQLRHRLGRRRKLVALLGVAAIALGAGVVAYATHLLRRSELQSIDARFSIRGRQRAPKDVVLVSIDPRTLQDLRRVRPPYPRRYDAVLIDRLREAGARVIAVDLEFINPTDPADDEALVEAIDRAHGKVVLATAEVAAGGGTRIFGEGNVLREIGARAAEVRLTTDADGVTRRFAYSYNGLHSFPVVSAELATGRPVARSRFEGGTLPIDFTGPPETFTSYSYSRVLRGAFAQNAFRGKVVIVGATAPILQDVHATATSGTGVMSGPEINASATSTLLRGAPLRDASGAIDIALIVLLGAAVPLASMRGRRWRAMLAAVALAALFTIGVQLAFDSGVIVTFVYPLLALALGLLGTLLVLYVVEAMERERVRNMFSRFVAADVVDDVLARTDENLRLGGVERDCTVLFSDLRGFTTFSETQPAARVIDVINYYLNEMTEAILAEGGTLISYIGDGILAIFGAPLEQPDHADRAFLAAREMIGPRLARLNARLGELGLERSFEMGVGLHSGPVMAGNVGSAERVEYTVIGDTVNTASRLEGLTKDSEAMLFVSAATHERMRRYADELTPVGEFSVRGRSARLQVWTAAPGERASEETGEPASDARERHGEVRSAG